MTDGLKTSEYSIDDVRKFVVDLIFELAPVQDVTDRSDRGLRLVEDLEYHSLALVELAFTIEDEFDLEPIDEESARSIATVGAVEEFVLQKLGLDSNP